MRQCQLTGKKANNGISISFSHKMHKRLQHVNLQQKRIWWAEGKRFVTLTISTKAIKTLQKKGLAGFAKEAGLDLNKL